MLVLEHYSIIRIFTLTQADPAPKTIPWDVIIHSAAGILCLILGALMFADQFGWALHAFSGMMILSFASALVISIKTQSWVTGHYLAMLPVIGIAVGYAGFDWGFGLSYALIWLAFIHFIWRGYQLGQTPSG